MLSFFPIGVLDEILNLIESVSEDFPSYSCNIGYEMVNGTGTITCLSTGKWSSSIMCHIKGNTNISLFSADQ